MESSNKKKIGEFSLGIGTAGVVLFGAIEWWGRLQAIRQMLRWLPDQFVPVVLILFVVVGIGFLFFTESVEKENRKKVLTASGQEFKRAKRMGKAALWSVIFGCIVGIVLVSVLGIWISTRSKELSMAPSPSSSSAKTEYDAPKSAPQSKPEPKAENARSPSGFMQFEKYSIAKEYNSISPGKKFGLDISSFNRSQVKVFNVVGYTNIFIEKAGPEADHTVRVKFDKIMTPIKEEYFAGKILGPERGPGTEISITAATYPLTKDEAVGIANGTLRLYFVSWIAWTDSQKNIDSAYDCRWLETPRVLEAQDVKPIFIYCQS